MRIRLLLAVSALVALAGATACARFGVSEESSGGDPPRPGAESGSAGDTSALPMPPPAGGGAASTVPPGMIAVKVAEVSYAIDAKEATIGEYQQFRDSHRDLSPAALPGCEWKTSFGPPNGCLVGPFADLPMSCVDWCDAAAYCQAAGKRLCGKIGGGKPVAESDVGNPTRDEWTRACAGGLEAGRWPYGSEADPRRCNTRERGVGGIAPLLLPSDSMTCRGGMSDLYDMSGNVAEWENSCDEGGEGERTGDRCATRGGSREEKVDDAKCDSARTLFRGETWPTVGIRCCKDL